MRRDIVAYETGGAIAGRHRADDGLLHFVLLGGLRVRWADTPIDLRLARQTLRLLAFLLIFRNRTHNREHAAFTLWPDETEADARAKLRRHLHLLSRALPESRTPWIVSTPTTLGWNPAATWTLDVAEFDRLGADIATAAQADALYGGDLLIELDDEWIVAERDRLRTRALETVTALVAHAARGRDVRAAIRSAARLRELDPWREDAVRTLIELRHRAGDRSGALAEYERFRAALAREFGVDPMPETTCVYERVVANDAGEETAREGLIAAFPAPDAHGMPFVGRERERDELYAIWQAAAAGAGTSVLIAGEAGIGKTRLIDELAFHVDGIGGRIIRGGTSPFELGPYQAIAEALSGARPLIRGSKLEPLWLAALVPLVPQLAVDFPALPPLSPLDSGPERTRLFEAIALAAGTLAATRPLLLILEDLHWAGPATIALIEYLARRAIEHRLLLVMSYREDDLARDSPLRSFRRRLERERLLRTTALGPLSRADITQLVNALSTGTPTERDILAENSLAHSDGNPFVIGELIANDPQSGLLDGDARRWQRREADVREHSPLAAMLRERLKRVSPQARSVIEIAAVIGRSFSAELVREVGGMRERATLDAVDELVDCRLVQAVDVGTADFAFSHQLIVQMVYEAITTDARARCHRRIGRVIEEMYGEQIEVFAAQLATHYDRGNDPERAAEYYRLAARQALGLYANAEAQSLAARGLELAVGDLTRVELLNIVEEAHRRLGERAQQRAVIAGLLELAERIGDPELLREALRRHIVLLHADADREAELAAIERLVTRLHEAPARWPAIAGQLKGSYLTAVGRYPEARRSLLDALASVVASDHPRIAVECRCALVELAGFDGHIHDVREFLTDLPTFSFDRYDAALAVTLLETACAAASKIQDYRTLADCAQRLLVASRSIGYLEGEAAAFKFSGRAAARLFDVERARRDLGRANDMFAALGQRLKQFHVLIDIGNLATSIGQFDRAIAILRSASDIAAATSYGFGQAASANNISYAAYLQGDAGLARSAAAHALAVAEAIDAPPARAHALVNLGVAERELGACADAIAHLEAGVALERELGESVAVVEDTCELIFALIGGKRIERASAVAAELARLSAKPLDGQQHPQYIFWALAAVAHANGDRSRARHYLSEARRYRERLEAAIPDRESRATFRKLPFHRAIDDAFDNDRWQ